MSLDRKRIAVLSASPHILVWNLASGKAEWTLRRLDEPDLPHHLRFSPNGKLLLAGSSAHVVLYDADSGKRLTSIRGAGETAEFSPDGSMIALGYGLRPGILLTRTSEPRPIALLVPRERGLSRIAFVADGKRLLSADERGNIRVWELPKKID
jgi:WD40 repeat protein